MLEKEKKKDEKKKDTLTKDTDRDLRTSIPSPSSRQTPIRTTPLFSFIF